MNFHHYQRLVIASCKSDDIWRGFKFAAFFCVGECYTTPLFYWSGNLSIIRSVCSSVESEFTGTMMLMIIAKGCDSCISLDSSGSTDCTTSRTDKSCLKRAFPIGEQIENKQSFNITSVWGDSYRMLSYTTYVTIRQTWGGEGRGGGADPCCLYFFCIIRLPQC